MPPPTLTSISPTSGLAVGDVFVQIVGTGFNLAAVGTVTVTFGGTPALRVGVASSTLAYAVVPPGDPILGAVDLVVANVTPQLVGPPLVEPATLPRAWTWGRPSIAFPKDLSNHSIVALVTRTLVSEFQRAVLKNTSHDRHPDYATAVDAAVPQQTYATLPSLKILGPRIRSDRWNNVNEPQVVDAGGGNFVELFKSDAVELEYDLVGATRDYAEASNLWREVNRYFEHADFLNVSMTSSRLGAEVAQFELEARWDAKGDFRKSMTRQGIATFSETFVVRGVTPNPDAQDWAGKEVGTLALSFFQVKPTDAPPFSGVAVETTEFVDESPDEEQLEAAVALLQVRVARLDRDDPSPINFTNATASPLVLMAVAPPDVVEEVKIVVTTAFSAGAGVQVGTAVTPGLMLGPGDVDAQVLGEYEANQAFQILAPTTLGVTITGAPTAGAGYVLYRVRR